MAEVFRAVAEGPGGFRRVLVIKRVLRDKMASEAFVEMFVSEARLSALLHHPNIVQIYDFGETDGSYFLAMEYLRGKDLATVMRQLRRQRRGLAAPIAAHVAHQLATGLAYAHDLTDAGTPLNIVHRDVTPSNVMLLRAGGVKLLDFGIARAAMKMRRETPARGWIKGKLAYLAPEQARGGTVDRRADVFSLGVVLWESLVGQPLFHGKDQVATMKNVLERAITPPSILRPGVPAALDFMVLRALERDPARRYPSAGAFAADLEAYLQEVRFSPRVMQDLLDELFGPDHAESPSDEAVMAASSRATPPPVPDEISEFTGVSSVKLPKQVRKPRTLGLAAGAGTLAVVAFLAFAHRSQPTTRPSAAVAAPAPMTVPLPVEPAPPVAEPEVIVQVQVQPPEPVVARPSAHTTAHPRRTIDRRASKEAVARARQALAAGELMRAEETLRSAVLLDPTDAEAVAALAEVRFERALYREAMQLASRAARLAPRTARYQVLLGDACFKLGLQVEADAAYARARQLRHNRRP